MDAGNPPLMLTGLIVGRGEGNVTVVTTGDDVDRAVAGRRTALGLGGEEERREEEEGAGRGERGAEVRGGEERGREETSSCGSSSGASWKWTLMGSSSSSGCMCRSEPSIAVTCGWEEEGRGVGGAELTGSGREGIKQGDHQQGSSEGREAISRADGNETFLGWRVRWKEACGVVTEAMECSTEGCGRQKGDERSRWGGGCTLGPPPDNRLGLL